MFTFFDKRVSIISIFNIIKQATFIFLSPLHESQHFVEKRVSFEASNVTVLKKKGLFFYKKKSQWKGGLLCFGERSYFPPFTFEWRDRDGSLLSWPVLRSASPDTVA